MAGSGDQPDGVPGWPRRSVPWRRGTEATPVRLAVSCSREGSKPDGRNRHQAGSVHESPARRVCPNTGIYGYVFRYFTRKLAFLDIFG